MAECLVRNDLRHVWVLAAPFRSHLTDLIETSGLPWRAVALYAEVPIRAARSLLFGRLGGVPQRIPPQLAIQIMSVSTGDLAALRRRSGDPGAAHAYARFLRQEGNSVAAIGLVTGHSREDVEAWLGGVPGWVSARAVLLLRTACHAAGMIDAEPLDPWRPEGDPADAAEAA